MHSGYSKRLSLKKANSRATDKDAGRDSGWFPGLEENLQRLSQKFGNSDDINIRRFITRALPAAIIYIQGLVDNALINDSILTPLLDQSVTFDESGFNRNPDEVLAYLREIS